jgi:hypothetical protein
LLGGLVFIGGRIRDELRRDGGHTIAFNDIECDPPEGLSREEFLEQTQYLANFPDDFNVLDPAVGPRIAEGFKAHPWVAEVQRVEQLPAGRLRVRLLFRQPVLVVDRPPGIVDRLGVLLPTSAQRKGLPVLSGTIPFPSGGPGHAWGDESVRAAASVAGFLREHLPALNLEQCTVEVDSGDVVLRTATTKVIWGRRPGNERSGEATADRKLQRLLDHPDLAGQENDVRPEAGIERRVLVP